MDNNIFESMSLNGLSPHKPLDLFSDGLIHRYRVIGDKSGSRNGWVVMQRAKFDFGAFGSWKTGESYTWSEKSTKTLTPQERAEFERCKQAIKQAQDEERKAVYQEAQAKAERLWICSKPANDSHPYLVAKGIKSYGLRQLREMLVVPLRDGSGSINSLQFISKDGTKRFLTGGRTKGCYYAIGRPNKVLLIAEGFATSATLFQATGHAVAVSFSAGNLLDVALLMRQKFPDFKIILCADNDRFTPGNPGMTKALEAARAIGGYFAVPRFREESV
jgi:putative DNA primase/helicase